MRQKKISVLGLYLYDKDLFSKMQLPAGMEAIRPHVIDNIILECSELECLYPDPDFMKDAIEIWSRAEQWGWEHLWRLANEEYNPIWNKDGTVIETETRDITNSGNTNEQSNGNSIDSAKGYNSNAWAESEKTDTTTGSSSQAANTESGTITHERRETGNIGVTTTQAMAREEIALAQMFSIYNEISKSFKKRFCLAIY